MLESLWPSGDSAAGPLLAFETASPAGALAALEVEAVVGGDLHQPGERRGLGAEPGLVLESRGLLPPHARTAFLLAMLWCLAIGSFAAATSYPLALALLFIAGFFELSFNAMAQTLVQVHAPSEVRGRVIGLFAMASLGLRAFSGVTVGLGGSLIGIHWSLAASAAALLALTMTLFSLTLRSAS